MPFASFATRGHLFVRTLAIGMVATTFEMEKAGGTIVVCKRLLSRFASDTEAARMLASEAELLRRLAGRGALRIVDAGEDEHGPFLVTERVDAPSLGCQLPLPLAPAERTTAARSAFAALACVHEATDDAGPLSIVHADMSPANVLVGAAHATIVDFGLASWRDAPRPAGGAFRGTLLYASPEAARGEALDARSDLFALAASVLHVASGQPPRTASEPAELLLQAGETRLDVYAERAGASLDPQVARALARCVAFERERRPESAREVFGA